MDSNVEKAEVPDRTQTPDNTFLPIQGQGAPLTRTKSATSNALARVSSHLTTRSITNPGPPPDGGLRAWVQVFCAWLALTNTWGFVNSFGAFQTYYASILPEPNSTISWIGSTQACLLFVVGIFSGRAFDAGWFRPTVLLGICVQILGIFTMSAAKNYWQLLLTQGICTGIGGGIFFMPVMSLVATYFAKRRGLAVGLVTVGNSVGGMIYPTVVRQLLPQVGFGWTVRVLGFVNVVCLTVVIAFTKPRLPPRKSGPLWDKDSLKDIPYILFVLGICCLMPAIYFVSYYVASFARDELGMPYTQSLNLVIILNGIGLPFRILPGFIGDRYLGPLNTFSICTFFASVILFCWLGVTSISSYYIFISFYGIFAAAFQSLFTTAIMALSHDITKTGTRLGMAMAVIGFSALVGGPLSGAILNASNYTTTICWAGASSFMGWGLCTAARVWKHGWVVRKKC
ncbi:hypothetical protein PMIN04_000483 [Paraphaeosphaeria minitans]|uniref:Major facilitator superfamily transporter n=1 Tax=Paraphaeosphaeria minitans TaxID=565426 RepID=A0A9P6KL57_9PLEO|nr:major facilitator superfamily transporter [Paraphaeosphaeria minitans]